MPTGTLVRAIHRKGTLRLLSPLSLPEGAQVSVIVFERPLEEEPASESTRDRRSTRLVPAKQLDRLTNLVSLGGRPR